jgi:predicted GNAT family acetyltransferase
MTSEQPPITVEHREHPSGGAFVVMRDGQQLAEMTYQREADDRVNIDHTLVDEKLRGLGVARKLLDAAVAWARETKTKVIATCPYARAQFDKDASIRDVLV